MMNHSCVMLIGNNPVDNLRNKNTLLRTKFAAHVLSHHSGQSALDYVQSVHTLDLPNAMPSLLFIDYDMPLMDGMQLVEMCHKRFETLEYRPSLVLLADVYNEVEDRFSKTYPMVLDYLPKPMEAHLHKLPSLMPI